MKVGGILLAVALAVTIGWAFVSYPRPAESIQAAAPERILIAYYSQSGHTEAVAKAIQQETGGDLYRIRTNICGRVYLFGRDGLEGKDHRSLRDLRPERLGKQY